MLVFRRAHIDLADEAYICRRGSYVDLKRSVLEIPIMENGAVIAESAAGELDGDSLALAGGEC